MGSWVRDVLLPFECALAVPIDFSARLLVTLLLPLAISLVVLLTALAAWRVSGEGFAARARLLRSPAIFNVHVSPLPASNLTAAAAANVPI